MAEIERARALDPLGPVQVLVGSNLLGLYLRRVLARRLGACAFVRTWTFLDLAEHRAGPTLRAAGRSPLPPLGADLIVSRAVASLPRGELDPVRGAAGLPRALLASIRDLKDAAWSPEDLTAAIAAHGFESSQYPKLERLCEIWSLYERGLREAHFYDRPDLLAAGGRSGPPPGSWNAAPLLVYGFYDLTELQWRLLLAESAGRAAAAFVPWEDGGRFDFARALLERLGGAGFLEVPAPGEGGPEEDRAAPLSTDRTGWSRMEEPALEILSAPTVDREAAEILRRVLGWAEEGIPFEEMALVTPGWDEASMALVRALGRAGIPFVLQGGRPLAGRRAARSAAALLAIVDEDWSREAVLRFLSIADLQPAITRHSAALAADWDLLTAEAGISGGRERLREGAAGLVARLSGLVTELEARAARGVTAEDAAEETVDEGEQTLRPADAIVDARWRLDAAEALASVLGAIEEAITHWPPRGPWSACAAGFVGALCALVRESEERELAVQALEPLAALDPIGPCPGPESFRDLALRALENASEPAGRFQKDGLLVADMLSVRGAAFRALVLAGAAEGALPARPEEDPFLLDEERAALGRAAPGRALLRAPIPGPLPAKSSRALEDRLLFELVTGAARARLCVSWTRLAEDGRREVPPSPFLGIDRGRPVTIVPLLPLAHPDPARAVDGAERRLSIAASLTDTDAAERSAIAALGGELPFLRRALLAEHARWERPRFSPFDGWLEGEAARRARGRLLPALVPATRLEEYAGCPLRAYFRRVLGLHPLHEPERAETLEPRDRGSLVHAILARFFDRLAGSRASAPKLERQGAEELRAALRMVAFAEFERVERRGVTGHALLWETERARILRELDGWLEFEIDRAERTRSAPLAWEWSFGESAAAADRGRTRQPRAHETTGEPARRAGPPAAFPLGPGEQILFSGRIDRIDRIDHFREDGPLRVIDYKTGRRRKKLEAGIRSGRAIQLPVYMRAAKGAGGRGGSPLEVVEGELLFIRDGTAPETLSREELAGLEDPLTAALATLVASVRSGDFSADPRDAWACRSCDFRSPCGASREALFARKRDDPRVLARMRLYEPGRDAVADAEGAE